MHSDPISADPIRPFPGAARGGSGGGEGARGSLGGLLRVARLDGLFVYVYIYIYIYIYIYVCVFVVFLLLVVYFGLFVWIVVFHVFSLSHFCSFSDLFARLFVAVSHASMSSHAACRAPAALPRTASAPSPRPPAARLRRHSSCVYVGAKAKVRIICCVPSWFGTKYRVIFP